MNIGIKKQIILAMAMLSPFVLCAQRRTYSPEVRIAFISDPHVQDVIGHPELVKTLDAQVQSTRMFNENIFAFQAALDDIVRRGIKHVVIPGDVSDDAQRLTHQSITSILDEYAKKYGLEFFLAPGNHDPAAPYGKHLPRKAVFLAEDGRGKAIVSDSTLCKDDDEVNPELFSIGHKEQAEMYSSFGFYPKEVYKYWSTPFCDYTYEDFSFERAKECSAIERRKYTFAEDNKAYELSYVVEPVDGVWLLSIDAGVYMPDASLPGGYKNSGAAGNNLLLTQKAFLVEWIKKVCGEAKRLNKKVIAFNHYPLLDCNDGASVVLARSWGETKFDIDRAPKKEITQVLFDAGVRVHFAGHMHIFDTAEYVQDGDTLHNIQIPSVATGVPAYAILNLKYDKASIEMVKIKDVPGFDTFFERYRKEYEYTMSLGREPVWNPKALETKSYFDFSVVQFQDLVRTRFAMKDVPKILQKEILSYSGSDLLKRFAPRAKKRKSMDQWTGMDLLIDFYRLHYSGSLAHELITKERLEDYNVLFNAVETSRGDAKVIAQMKDFVIAFKCFFYEKEILEFSY